MYYNMTNFKELETKNYILDLELAQRYHYNFERYPLPMDLALPLYAQTTIISFESVVGIIEGVRKKDLLYEGDRIRVDEVKIEDLQETIKKL